MTNSKGNFIRITINLVVFLLVYFVASLLKSDVLCNIMSPINSLSAAGVLFFAYLKSQRTLKVSFALLLFSLACTFWGIAEILWAIISFNGGSPGSNPILWFIYFIPNCLILYALIVYAFYQFRKWDIMQSSIDLIIIGSIIIVLFWIVFLKKDFLILYVLMNADFTGLYSIITDIMIFIIVFSWVLSIRSGNIPAFLRIMASGTVLYASADMLYYYLYFHGQYIPNSLIDCLYIFSLMLIAYGALWKIYKNRSVLDVTIVLNTGGKRRWIYLLLFPLVTALLSVSGIIKVQVNSFDIIIFCILILIYWLLGKYVQVSLEKESLLKQNNEILERRVAKQASELSFLANQDTLTTLFNRRYFMTRLDEAINHKCESDMIALMLIDMDRFKTINDTFGHDVGDMVLIDLSNRIIEWNDHGATIARLGGDEFALMITGKYTQQDIEVLCKELIDLFNKPVSIGEKTLNMTTSVGIALIAMDDCDGKMLMQNAEIAMYRAKSRGYNRFQVYDPLMSQDLKRALEIETLLSQADAEKDFLLYYQPQYSLPEMELIGAEALIRWNNPEHGFIPPNVFIPIAEQLDYIFKIGEWVTREAILQAKKWNEQSDRPLKVGFNVSPKQFHTANYMKLIKTLVTESNVNPSWLDAEITESVMIENKAAISEAFSVLQELGITVSIDDFGSGYSALGNLNIYQFDRIKMDKSLIDNVNLKSMNGVSIVRAAINMAHASGIKTIAEGVETQEQLNILINLDCDQVQGYFLGRPVPAAIFEERYMK